MWRDLPSRFGPWKTVHERHQLWSADGTWERLLQQVQADADAAGDIDWGISVDSTVMRPHQHAAGACRAPPPRVTPAPKVGWARNTSASRDGRSACPSGGGGEAGEGLGRSRGGFTTKVHLSAEGRCRPLSLVVTPGQRADCTQFKPVMDRVRVPGTGRGGPGDGRTA
ncbi:IS5 family transposase [Streptomyces roseoverticillatus]|nr:IS5 family transposase [Streptomyces roseoverticillatus]